MNRKKTDKEEILALAQKTKHYCELLIKQSDSWLPEEEQKTESAAIPLQFMEKVDAAGGWGSKKMKH